MQPIMQLFELARQTANITKRYSHGLSLTQIAQAKDPDELMASMGASLKYAAGKDDPIAISLQAEFEKFRKTTKFKSPALAAQWQEQRHKARFAAGVESGSINSRWKASQTGFDKSGAAFRTSGGTVHPPVSLNEAIKTFQLNKMRGDRIPKGIGMPEVNRSELLKIQNEIEQFTGLTSGTGRVMMTGLTDDQRFLFNRRIRKALGSNYLPEELGLRPDFVQSAMKRGKLQDRPLMRYMIPREEFLRGNDTSYGLIVESQMSRQLKLNNYTDATTGLGSVFETSGLPRSVAGYDVLAEQTRNRLVGSKSSAVFDVETPSLDVKDRIRQLSARFYDKEGKEITGDAINYHFHAPTMGLGHYGAGSFDELVKNMGGTMIEDEHVGAAMKEFFVKANRHNVMVAHNAEFDVRMIKSMLDDPRVAPVLAKDREFQAAAKTFFDRADTSALVDTVAHARMLMSGLGVAKEYSGDIGKQFSLENIILQSSFLDDIVKNADDKDAMALEVKSRITNLHMGEVDTWFTGHLRDLEERAYRGEKVLRPTTSAQMGSSLFATPEERDLVRKTIVREGAINPFTNVTDINKMSDKYVQYLQKQGIKIEGARTTSHLEQMMFHTRSLTPTGGDVGLQEVLNAGRSVPIGKVVNPEEWAAVQSGLTKAQIPFAGLSHSERTILSAMGQMGPAGGESLKNTLLRNNIANTLGVSAWETHARVGVFGAGAGRSGIVAMPTDMVKELEALTLKTSGKSVFQTNLSAADRTFASVSAFSVGEEKRASLNIKPFEGLNRAQISARMNVIRPKIAAMAEEGKYGLTSQNMDSVLRALENSAVTAGVQIGTNKNADMIYDVLEGLGLRVDRAGRPKMLTALGEEAGGILNTFGNWSTVGDQIKDPEFLPGIEADVSSAEKMYKGYTASRTATKILEDNISLGDVGPEAAKTISWMEKNVLPHYTLKNLGLATAAGVGYYVYRKRKKDAIYNETLGPQDYESNSDRKRNMMLMPSGFNKTRNPLTTAGLVQALGNNSIGHYRMGSKKDSHLYSGAM